MREWCRSFRKAPEGSTHLCCIPKHVIGVFRARGFHSLFRLFAASCLCGPGQLPVRQVKRYARDTRGGSACRLDDRRDNERANDGEDEAVRAAGRRHRETEAFDSTAFHDDADTQPTHPHTRHTRHTFLRTRRQFEGARAHAKRSACMPLVWTGSGANHDHAVCGWVRGCRREQLARTQQSGTRRAI